MKQIRRSNLAPGNWQSAPAWMWCFILMTINARLRVFVYIVVSLLVSSAPLNSQTARPPDKLAAEHDIREAVIRYQMEGWFRDGDKHEQEAKDPSEKAIATALNFKIFFVAINGKDPSEDFVKRLRDIPRVVKKVSESKISKKYGMAVLDKTTGQRGIIFSADSIRWLSKDSAMVEGGYRCNGLCAAGMTFTVEHKSGKWVVKSSEMHWIS